MRTHEPLNWRIEEWGALALIFGLLLVAPVLNGFPFLFPDSWGYSGACPDEIRSPVIGCAMRPFTWAGGNWAYAVVQCAATAFTLVLLWSRVLKRQHTGALCIAVIASGLGLFSGWVMADVWTLTGLISLFVIAAGHYHPVVAGLLAFSCGAHFGNFPTFSAVALAVLPVARERLRYVVRIVACLLGAVALIVAANLVGGRIKFGSGNGFVFLASRILHDNPEVLELKCREDPDFQLCRQKEEVLAWSAQNHQSFTWAGFYSLGLDWPDYNRLCGELVRYSLRGDARLFYEQAAAAVRNTGDLLIFPELSNGLETFGPDSFVVGDLRIAFPEDVQPYLRSRQASGGLEGLLKKMDAPFIALIWLSIFSCLLFGLAGWRSRGDDPLIQLALFALVAAAANAFFMSNLSGVFGRYQARIGFLLVFPALALIFRWVRSKLLDLSPRKR
jgi:hypothetical protein